jgi:hypothetical protein
MLTIGFAAVLLPTNALISSCATWGLLDIVNRPNMPVNHFRRRPILPTNLANS